MFSDGGHFYFTSSPYGLKLVDLLDRAAYIVGDRPASGLQERLQVIESSRLLSAIPYR